MKKVRIIVHRGSHQIGGVATEIRTPSSRIVIDMGDELSLDPEYVPKQLSISGVTDEDGGCDAVLFTHYHGDHVGQLEHVRSDIPIYIGRFAQVILQATAKETAPIKTRIDAANTFVPGEKFRIGDIDITPFSVDHSACDSYMFLVEADGKRILHTGDFRLHGFRGKAIPKILDKLVGKVDALITEGTTLSRTDIEPVTERELQQTAGTYMEQYKYVFVLCASTNLERICALSKAVPSGKYFICDAYQNRLLDLLEQHWGDYSPLYRNIKKTWYGDNKLNTFKERGFLMTVRDSCRFREIIKKFDPAQSIILYSLWDGYRTRQNSTIPDFLSLTNQWASLHTSGHASVNDICQVIAVTNPEIIVPIHTENPAALKQICRDRKIVILQDGEELSI